MELKMRRFDFTLKFTTNLETVLLLPLGAVDAARHLGMGGQKFKHEALRSPHLQRV
jgi:hypothetical protein